MKTYTLEQSSLAHFFAADKKSAVLWFLLRLYVGYEWLMAGWEKVMSPVWFGSHAGQALGGFIQGALAKTSGMHPDVAMWYASFLQNVVGSHLVLWSNLVALGELCVGLGLIVGLFTGIAAFFGSFMNLNYLLAGTVSVNPILLALSIPLVLAWRVAGYWGLDRYAHPYLTKKFRGRFAHR